MFSFLPTFCTSTSIRLFDVSSGEKRKLDAKFPGGVSGLQYSQCGCFLVACVRESREVFLFDIRATAVSTQPLCIISVLGTPSNVAVRSFDSHIDILCWFECTDGCMIRYNLARGTAASTNIEPDTEKKTKKKKKSLSKLDNEDSDKEHTNGEANMGDRSSLFAAYSMTKIQSHGEISCASFGRPGNPSADGITIITDSHSTPCFQYAEHSSNATPDEILTNIVLPIPSSSSDLNNLKLNKSGASDNNSNNNSSIANSSVMMLGPFESGGKQLPHLGEDGENLVLTTDKKQRRTSFDESTLVTSVSRSATKKRSNSEVSMDSVSSSTSLDELKGKRNKQGIELTIEQRLEQLSSKANEIDQLQRVEQTNSNTTTTVTSSSSASGLPSSDSLVVLIEQALQASDDTLLEQCLSCQESSVIETTTRLLPTSKAINFLMKIIAKFEKRPSRVMLLLPWLNHLLQQHATFLSGFPNFAKTFASLSQILEQRVSCLNSFTALNGRLDLIMHQSLSSLSPSSSSLTGSSQQQSHLRNNGLSDGPAKQGGLGTNSPMAVHNEDDEE